MASSSSNTYQQQTYIELKHLTKDAETKVLQTKNKMNRYFSHIGAKNKFTKN